MRVHESSLSRFFRRFAIFVTCLLLAYGLYQVIRSEVNRPLPPIITPEQKERVDLLSKKLSLATWTWSVEAADKTVLLYDPAIKAWRKIQ